jgi:hypothetical protein
MFCSSRVIHPCRCKRRAQIHDISRSVCSSVCAMPLPDAFLHDCLLACVPGLCRVKRKVSRHLVSDLHFVFQNDCPLLISSGGRREVVGRSSGGRRAAVGRPSGGRREVVGRPSLGISRLSSGVFVFGHQASVVGRSPTDPPQAAVENG